MGKIHVKHVYEIAFAKQRDENLERIPIDSICRMIVGQCSSMGIEVSSERSS